MSPFQKTAMSWGERKLSNMLQAPGSKAEARDPW